MNRYRRLTETDRENILIYTQQEKKQAEIAETLGVFAIDDFPLTKERI
jgi:IS30 family transposase